MDFYFVVAGVVTSTLVILTCASWVASYTGVQDEAATRYTIVTPAELGQEQRSDAASTDFSTTQNKDTQGAAQSPVDSPIPNSGHVINCECPADGRPLSSHIPSKA